MGVVDIVKDDRLAFGGDSSREPFAEWNADARFDLFLDADGGARDKLVRGVIEKKHGTRIDVDDLADAGKQRGEQFIEFELAERDVRNRLERFKPSARVALCLEEVGMGDRRRGTISSERETLDVMGIELARFQGADVDHAEQPLVGEQRDTEERFDALFEQDRVDDR
jgi:hypothetical protein